MDSKHHANDKGVAVVIAALLMFVILTTLLSAYVLWYVPTNGAQNDITYNQEALNSLLQLQGEVSSPNLQVGGYISQEMPMGTAGSPPFSSSTDSFINMVNDTIFKALMQYSVLVNVSAGAKEWSLSLINYSANGTGEIIVNPNSQYINPGIFIMQDNSIIQYSPKGNYSSFLGNVPVSIVNNRNISLNASVLSITGENSSFGTYGSSLITLELIGQNAASYYKNQSLTMPNGTAVTIKNIHLYSFNYTIRSSFASGWNASMFSNYDPSGIINGSYSSGFYWNYSSFTFSYDPINEEFKVSIGHHVVMSSVNLVFKNTKLLSL